jgi:hypothetical protein
VATIHAFGIEWKGTQRTAATGSQTRSAACSPHIENMRSDAGYLSAALENWTVSALEK